MVWSLHPRLREAAAHFHWQADRLFLFSESTGAPRYGLPRSEMVSG